MVAGHPQILKIGTGKVIERIGRGSYPLGIKNGVTWEALTGTLEPGERLLLHSDWPDRGAQQPGARFRRRLRRSDRRLAPCDLPG